MPLGWDENSRVRPVRLGMDAIRLTEGGAHLRHVRRPGLKLGVTWQPAQAASSKGKISSNKGFTIPDSSVVARWLSARRRKRFTLNSTPGAQGAIPSAVAGSGKAPRSTKA